MTTMWLRNFACLAEKQTRLTAVLKTCGQFNFFSTLRMRLTCCTALPVQRIVVSDHETFAAFVFNRHRLRTYSSCFHRYNQSNNVGVRCFCSQEGATSDSELNSSTGSHGLQSHKNTQGSKTQDTDSQSVTFNSKSSHEFSTFSSKSVHDFDSDDSLRRGNNYIAKTFSNSGAMLDSVDSLDACDVYKGECVEVFSESNLTHKELEGLEDFPEPKPVEPSYNLAPYVPKSEVLQKLVSLGVDLSAVEKISEASDFIVQASWSADIQPRLFFLRDLGVEDSQLGHVLTKNPLLLKEDIEDMQLRVHYLRSKQFSQDQVGYIVQKAPLTLLLPVKYIDKKLGFLQTSFHLTGDEVRAVATKLPKIIPWKLQKLKDIRFYVKEMLGFSDKEQKAMLLATPRVYLSSKHHLGERFDYLYNTMGLTHQQISAWPSVFRTRLHILRERHRFLLLVGRTQYDPTKENYVPLKAIVSGKDQDFCVQVAKAPTAQFNNFLKTL